MKLRLYDESAILSVCMPIALPPVWSSDVKHIILYKTYQAMVKKISSAQMRAARALLRWSALDLATASKVGVATIRRVEVVDGEIPVTLANEAALRRALEAAGIEFIEENGGGEGVRFRKLQTFTNKLRS
jgi:hypothetical protein